eukprot:Nitzschia sp. Nitz4//scaffold501_size4582//1266//1986//NITZ4_009239-RA/size4582-snap-gene-0.1-mRNA-1//-1//CDS//3329553587//1018//frame0
MGVNAILRFCFVGQHSLVIDVFPLLSPKHFVTTLKDVIRFRRTMDTIISDRGSNKISNRVKDLLHALYVAYILNHTAARSIGWRTRPLEKLTGVTPDISAISRFRFWEPVYFAMHDPSFPSDSTKLLGRFLGFAHHVGHALTFQILNLSSGRVLQRSQIRSAVNPGEVNARLPAPPPIPSCYGESQQ